MTLAEELTELERRFWTGDEDFYEQRLTADCRMAFPQVGFLDRATAIAGIASGPRWTEVDFDEIEVASVAEGVSLISYRATARRDGDESPYTPTAASLYRREDDRWMLAYHQQTA